MIVQCLQRARRAATRHAVAAQRAGFAAHEQALTEVVLTRAAPAAHVCTFTQPAEARTGADWLWWWQGGGEWFGALVQAKRNKPVRSRPSYNFGYETGAGHRQVDLLLMAARRLGVPAVYVLYNQPPIPRSVPVSTPCCTVGRESWRTRLRVGVVPGLVARALIRGTEDAAVQYTRPLECLACAGSPPRLLPPVRATITDRELTRFLTVKDLPLPRLVARRFLADLAEMRSAQFRQVTPQFDVADLATRDRVFAELPTDRGHFAEPYFEHVLRGLRRTPPWYVAAALDGVSGDDIGQEFEGVEGLVIFSDRGDE